MARHAAAARCALLVVVAAMMCRHVAGDQPDPAVGINACADDKCARNGTLSTRPDFTKKLASYVTFQGKRPRIVMLVAPCRSGTTAMSRAVAYSGQTVVYQKVKEALRLVLVAELGDQLTAEEQAYFHVDSTPELSLALPVAPEPEDGSPPTLFLKETFGGAHPLESYYDPLSVLLEAGWPADMITVITMTREPLASFASWVQHWGEGASNGHGGASTERLAGNYAAAVAAVANTRAVARAAGVLLVSLDYEAFARAPPATVLGAVLAASGLHAASFGAAEATTSWLNQPDPLTSDGGRLHMPRGQGHIDYLRSVHAALLNSPGLQYRRRKTPELLAVVGPRWATKVAHGAEAVIEEVKRDTKTMVGRWQDAVEWANEQATAAAASSRPDLTTAMAKFVTFQGRRPRIVLMVAPCRSGTTPLARSVAKSGKTIVFHKIKVALRHLLVEHLGDRLSESEQAYFHVDETPAQALALPTAPQPEDGSRPTLFMKESFCGGHPLESYYDPLSVLLEAGWPADMITVITVAREPLATFASWVDLWGAHSNATVGVPTSKLARRFAATMAAVANTRAVAKDAGVPVVSLDYEAFARSPPSTVLGAVLAASGLHASERGAAAATASWRNFPDPVSAVRDRLRLPNGTKQADYLRTVHASLLKSRGFSFRRRPTAELMAVVGDEWAGKVHGSTAGMYLAIQRDCITMVKKYRAALAAVAAADVRAVAAERPDFTKKLASYVTFQGKRPRIVMLVAPCRSGTTAMSRAVAYSGQTVVYQKVKEALRLVLVAELGDQLTAEEQAYFHVDSTPELSLALPVAPEPEDGSPPTLFLKETFGGAHPLESYYDPLSVLLEAGWPADMITVITMTREPLASFASWVQHWGEGASNGHGGASTERLAGNYAAAVAAVANTRAVARAAGVSLVSLDYEAFARAPPDVVLGAVLATSGLYGASRSAAAATSSWLSQPDPLTGDGGRLHMPRGQGHIDYLRSVHAALLKSQGLEYRRRKTPELLAVVGEEWAAVVHASSMAVIEDVRKACMSMVMKWQTAVSWAAEQAAAAAAAKRPDLTTALAKRMSFVGPRPRVVLLVAPCKSGTTALARAVARTGQLVLYQRIKAGLRLLLAEHLGDKLSQREKDYFAVNTTVDEALTLPAARVPEDGSPPTLFLKESFCGGHPLESYYDPLSVLLEAGWTPETLVLMSVAREPLPAFASWVNNWGEGSSDEEPGVPTSMLASRFAAAMAAVANARQVARDAGVPIVSLDYEAFDRESPVEVLGAVLSAAGAHEAARAAAEATIDWSNVTDAITAVGMRLQMPVGMRHSEYLRNVHASLLRSRRLEYRRKPTAHLMRLVGEEWAEKVHGSVAGTYGDIQADCMTMLKLYKAALSRAGARVTNLPPLATPAAQVPMVPVPGPVAASFGMGTGGWTVVSVALLAALSCATSWGMDPAAGKGRRRSRARPGGIAGAGLVLVVWTAVTWATFAGKWGDLAAGTAGYLRYLETQNDEFRSAGLYVQREDLPAVAWGIATAWARQPPSVQILGAQKAGTTSLHAMLMQHPDVAAGVAKESHFVDGRSVFGTAFHNVSTVGDVAVARAAYASMFPSIASRLWHMVTHGGRDLTVVDATPVNVMLPSAPTLLHAINPAARLIVVLREPVERAWSHYRHNQRWGRETLPLGPALVVEDRLWLAADAAAAAGSEVPLPSVEMMDKSYVRRGLYAEQLARYVSKFGRDSLLVLSFEDVSQRPAETMQRVFQFLGLPQVPVVPEQRNQDTRTRGSKAASKGVPADVRALLVSKFTASNARLEKELGLSFVKAWPRTAKAVVGPSEHAQAPAAAIVATRTVPS